jgi:phosphatidate phosphatase LPIN
VLCLIIRLEDFKDNKNKTTLINNNMQAWGRLGGYIRRGVCSVSGPFLPFGGAVDIIVVQQKDGSFKSSPWYVRFGKFHRVMKAAKREKVKVSVSVNGVETDFHMCLNPKGEAFFLHANSQHGEGGEEQEEELLEQEEDGTELWSYDDIQLRGTTTTTKRIRSKSCNYNNSERLSSEDQVLAGTGSRGSRIYRFVFGPSSNGGGEDADGDLVERAEIAAKLLELRWSTNLTFDELPYRERRKSQGDELDKEKAKSESSKILRATTLQLPEVNDV